MYNIDEDHDDDDDDDDYRDDDDNEALCFTRYSMSIDDEEFVMALKRRSALRRSIGFSSSLLIGGNRE